MSLHVKTWSTNDGPYAFEILNGEDRRVAMVNTEKSYPKDLPLLKAAHMALILASVCEIAIAGKLSQADCKRIVEQTRKERSDFPDDWKTAFACAEAPASQVMSEDHPLFVEMEGSKS